MLKREAFIVGGIKIITNNKLAFEKDTIGKLWNDFNKNNISSRIKNKVDDKIIVVYDEYDNDRNGDYSVLIGHEIPYNDNEITYNNSEYPALCRKHIPGSDRLLFSTNKLNSVDLWKEIWIMEDKKEIDRSYGCDYEVYGENIEIYIDIK